MQYLARYRSLLGAAICALVLCGGLGLAAPARADDRFHHDPHWRDPHWRDRCCYAPPVPVYAPPPVYVPPAPVAPGINLIIPFHFR